MLDAENLVIDPQRIKYLLSLYYILIGMHDAIGHLQYDQFHYDLLDAIKVPLKQFVDGILERLEDEQDISNEQCPTVTTDDELMRAFEDARRRLVFNEQNSKKVLNVESVTGIY